MAKPAVRADQVRIKVVWIVLLDRSGSMGDPFEATGEVSRRTMVVEAEKKLDAAKQVLREELAEFRETDPNLRVSIFAFSDTPQLVYAGAVADLPSIDRALDGIRPGGGTDIAAALDAAAAHKAATPDPGVSQSMLISDGKSDRAKATAAARRCLANGLALVMLLIDPTDEGKAFARDVVRAVGGTYQIVTSRTSLQDAAKEVAESHAAAQAHADMYLEAAACEAETVEEVNAERERVTFTAGYPGTVALDADYLLRVYLHLDRHLDEVGKRLTQAAEAFGAYPRRGDAVPNQVIEVGTSIEVTPRIERIGVSPRRQELTWAGELEELSFRIFYAGPPEVIRPCSGFIDFEVFGLLVAQIPVSIQVEGEQHVARRASADMIRRVFASYAHDDEPIVRACKEAYRGLGIQLFVDKDDILSGDRWRDVIRQAISNHDLFQLFWSQRAADSDEVANEWKLAADIAATRSSGFIRPVFWEKPMPAPPDKLGGLHFARLDLDSLQVHACAPPAAGSTARPAPRPTQLEASFAVLDTVGSDPEAITRLQQDMARVVPFLEDLVGVRYFPPVTFLVDEHTVVAARHVLTTDTPDGGDDAPGPVLPILQALALAFHVGALTGGLGWSQREEFYDVADGQARADYAHVAQMTEYLFSGPVSAYLDGEDVLASARRTLRELLEAAADGDGYAFDAAEFARHTVAAASADERAALADVVSDRLISDLEASDGRSRAAAVQLLETGLPALAESHGVVMLFDRNLHSLRHCATFGEYIAGFMRQWLGYVEVAERKRPDTTVDVGFGVPVSALDWLRRHFPEIGFQVIDTKSNAGYDEPQAYIKLTIADYRRCVERLSDALIGELTKPRRSARGRLVNTIAATHGVYIPAEAGSAQAQLAQSLADRGWPAAAALPGQHKVVLSVEALDRFRSRLRTAGHDEAQADDMTRRFGAAILVHEHFHAALAAGLDRAGHPAAGAEHPDRWAAAGALNESLAAWCERHFHRADPEMLEYIDSYIADGEYPAWPYRGAQAVESFFESSGAPAVRGWMRDLRDDPENAQREFDQRARLPPASR